MQQEHLLMGEWLDSLMHEQWGGKASLCVLDGKVHTVATDGQALVLVEGAWGSAEVAQNRTSMVKSLLNGLAEPVYSSTELPLKQLRAWLPTDPETVPCVTCNGGAIKEFRCTTCGGSGVDECPHCGNEAECPECGGAKKSMQCAKCEGDGWVSAEASYAPIRSGVVINRRILQRFLGGLLTGETVTLSTGSEIHAVFIKGPSWTVLVMPARYTDSLGPLGQPLELP
jgi:hypothetical protein